MFSMTQLAALPRISLAHLPTPLEEREIYCWMSCWARGCIGWKKKSAMPPITRIGRPPRQQGPRHRWRIRLIGRKLLVGQANIRRGLHSFLGRDRGR